MWRLYVVLSVILVWCIPVWGQQLSEAEALLRLMGAEDPEYVDAAEAERLAAYLERPMKINMESLASLVASGLMSRYQAAALDDYRSRHGDILSFMELAAVDGFGEDFVRALSPFISLQSVSIPGQRRDTLVRVENDMAVRGGMKMTGSPTGPELTWSYGGKYRCRAGDRISLSLAASEHSYTGHISYRFRKVPLKVLAGDFNARFGQGLALWNGMTMSGLSSPASFMKNPSGISESWSFKGINAFTGIAAESDIGYFTCSAFAAFPELKEGEKQTSILPALSLSWNGRNIHVGLTHYARFDNVFSLQPSYIPDMKSSADISMCVKGMDLFAELVFDWINVRPAALGGLVIPACETMKVAVMARYYPSDFAPYFSGAVRSGSRCENEHAVTLSGQVFSREWIRSASGTSSSRRHDLSFSLDAAYFPESKDNSGMRSIQFKGILAWEYYISGNLRLNVRLSERLRSWGYKARTDLRTDVLWMSGCFSLAARMNALQCRDLGLLGYLEGGYSTRGISAYLKAGMFRIDNWDDRIYAYERDAPGSFNVPSFYGRGLWLSSSFIWRFATWGRMYVRASMTSYPFMKEEKPGKAELKLQGVFSF